MKITDEAVQAATKEYIDYALAHGQYANPITGMRNALTAALPHLTAPCSGEVKKLEWGNTKPETNDLWLCHENPEYEITRWWLDDTQDECGHFEVSELGEQQFGTLEEAKAAAQADFDRRILSAIITKPVDVSAVRKQAFEEAAKIADEFVANYIGGSSPEAMACFTVSRRIGDYIRALSAEPAQIDQWQDISTAPKDGTYILTFMKRKDGGTHIDAQAWPKNWGGKWPSSYMSYADGEPTHWMPLPAAPTSKGGE